MSFLNPLRRRLILQIAKHVGAGELEVNYASNLASQYKTKQTNQINIGEQCPKGS